MNCVSSYWARTAVFNTYFTEARIYQLFLYLFVMWLQQLFVPLLKTAVSENISMKMNYWRSNSNYILIWFLL